MKIKITPRKLTGKITPPPSKSQAHRLLMGAALADGKSVVHHVSESKDMLATIRCLEELGAVFTRDRDTVEIVGIGNRISADEKLPELPCGESGSTLRFLIPIALQIRGGGVFSGEGRLMERPQEPYEKLFSEKKIRFERKGDTLIAEGRLKGGIYQLAGNISSQFITGLLFALPLLSDDSEIMLTTPLESSGYIDLTLDALKIFGIQVEPIPGGWRIPGGQSYRPCVAQVESDYSQAGFFFAAKSLGNPLEICGLSSDSAQGDRVILEQMKVLNAPGNVTINVKDCPDLVPPLSLIAALRDEQETTLVGAERLRMKESDRLHTVAEQLNRLGCRVTEGADYLHIQGVKYLHGGVVSGENDHRIAMMLAMAATVASETVTLLGADCVEKSYPDFWGDYVNLGGSIEREN